MNYFFDSKENQGRLEKILYEWIGTPWRHWSGVKNLGTDCIHFAVRVLEELGFDSFTIPNYPRDWNLHNSNEDLLDNIKKQLNCIEVNVNIPMNGDIVLFYFGKMSSHVGFYFNDHIFQAVTNIGVIRTHWMDQMWYKRKRYALRILK